jgi:hypothetical protein
LISARVAFFQLVVSATLMAAAVDPAVAAKVVSGPISIGSSNLGSGVVSVDEPFISSQNQIAKRVYATTDAYAITSEVQTPPTETSAGLLYQYQTRTTTTSWLEDSWSIDQLVVNAISSGANQAGGKWLSIAGNLTSGFAYDFAFSLESSGHFTPTSTPFGQAVPLLASFYFGPGPDPRSVVPVPGSGTFSDLSSLTYESNTFSSSHTSTKFSLTPGAPQSFIAYVYSGDGVSIERFSVFAKSGQYDFSTASRESVVIGSPVLIGAQTIAPIPEADPVVMLAAGLGLTVAISGRRRRIATP